MTADQSKSSSSSSVWPPNQADVRACPRCGGALKLIACVTDRLVATKILRHLGLPAVL